jgi:non-heme chloroperoxidase
VECLGSSPVLIGHSMGGMVVQMFSGEQQVPGLVLMASVPPYGLAPSLLTMGLTDPDLLGRISLLETRGDRASMATLARALFSVDGGETAARRYIGRMHGGYSRAARDLMRHDLVPLRARYPAPVLVLGARNDAFLTPVAVRATARTYATRAHIFPDMAHAMMLEPRWEQVAEHIAAWLQARFG